LHPELNSTISGFMRQTSYPRSISEIIRAAGGPARVADASSGEVSVDAVYKWPKIGIPDRHWSFLMPLAGASAEEMLAANVAARAPSDAEPAQ
jgi:predicted RNA polymerase sigma factor